MDDSKKLLHGNFFIIYGRLRHLIQPRSATKKRPKKPAVNILVSGLIKSEMLHNYICRLV